MRVAGVRGKSVFQISPSEMADHIPIGNYIYSITAIVHRGR